MPWIASHPISYLSYGLLFLSVLLLWLPLKRTIPIWAFTLLTAIILGLISHQLETIALLPIILLIPAAYYSQAANTSIVIRIIAGIFIIALGLGLATHQFPGFNNLKVLDNVIISHNAIPYSLYLNFDKTMVGILVLGLGFQLITEKREWVELFKQVMIKAPIIILILIVLAIILGFVKFDPKIPSFFLIWSATNLLFVCMAEEAMFRGFIQKNLALIMTRIKGGDYLAILITAILFGLAHYPGGVKYVILAAVAGIGYGWIYASTKRIESSILTHFGLNLTHFLFFTYPALIPTP